MKYKTSNLEGTLLDAAVALADGRNVVVAAGSCFDVDERDAGRDPVFRPSVIWAQAGPIIEREHIELHCRSRSGAFIGDWFAGIGVLPIYAGPTPLVAAMRAYVASKLGAEVEL